MRILAISVAIVIAGCAGSGRVRYDTPAEAYTKGKDLFDAGKYTSAVEYLQGAFDFGRAHEYAADAQLLLARAHRENGDYLLAGNEYQRFIQIYRSDPRVEEASFEYALTFIERSPQYQLDQTDTRRAVSELQLFIDRFPDSDRVVEADAEIRKLREKLAHKDYESARLYERRELFESAAITFEAVFDEYPDTGWADDAIVGAIRNYIEFSRRSVVARQAERYEKAAALFERLEQIFPNSPLLDDARRLVQASSNLASG